MSDRDIVLNILAQQPSLNLYTQICLCFPVDDIATRPRVVEKLSKGLELLAAGFPWIAGKIINDGASEGNTGIYKIRLTGEVPLVVKDLKNDTTAPTMEDLRKVKFPIRMLDENLLCPRRTMLRNSLRSESEEFLPVFIVQANFIVGGLILAFLGHHQAMDMVGQGQIMRLLSEACSHVQFTKPQLENGQLDCDSLIPLFEESWESEEKTNHPRVVETFKESKNSPESVIPKSTWAYFTVNGAGLAHSRTEAWNTMPIPPEYVSSLEPNATSSNEALLHNASSDHASTDDIITAFIWQSIARVRLCRLNPTDESTLGRAVDARRYLEIPTIYPGCMASKVQHKLSLQSLTTLPLIEVALQLRKAIDPRTSTVAHDVRKNAIILSRTADKSRPKSTTQRDLGLDVSFSSWRKIDICGLEFGLGLGLPTVRRPKFEPLEGVVYIMPKPRDVVGDDVIAICLRDEDMERLRGDRQFGEYASFIG